MLVTLTPRLLAWARGFTRATLSKSRNVLAMAFDFAIRREEMDKNLARRITLPVVAEPGKVRKSFDAEQAKMFLAGTVNHRWHAMWLVGLNLGLRPGELTALGWDSIDLEAGVLTVERGVQKHGRKSVVTDEVKTKGSRRAIKMPANVVEALRRHREVTQLENAVNGVRTDLVFHTSTGTVIELHNLLREFRKLAADLGLGGSWTPNEMRHTAASLLIDQGVPMHIVADILGHKTTRMLEMTYRHASPVVAVPEIVASTA